MGKAVGLSCLISKPNTYESRRDQLTCPWKDDSKCLAGKRRDILRMILYYNRLVNTELFRLHSSKETRGDKPQLPLTVIWNFQLQQKCYALAFSTDGMPSCIHLMFFIPKERDLFKNMSEELLMSFYMRGERNKANACTSKGKQLSVFRLNPMEG